MENGVKGPPIPVNRVGCQGLSLFSDLLIPDRLEYPNFVLEFSGEDQFGYYLLSKYLGKVVNNNH